MRNKDEISNDDVEKLAKVLKRDFPTVRPSDDSAWSREPALRVIDCVLSLNRNYDKFVVKRLDEFEQHHPEITSVRSLRDLIDSSPTPADFVKYKLDYDHPYRARILKAVVDFTLGIIGDASAELEINRLEQWAKNAEPQDYKNLGIHGFGIAGFQYLRMLFGANTTKPDKHICKYVAEAVGHNNLSEFNVIKLLEKVAEQQNILLRDVDTSIWEKVARKDKN